MDSEPSKKWTHVEIGALRKGILEYDSKPLIRDLRKELQKEAPTIKDKIKKVNTKMSKIKRESNRDHFGNRDKPVSKIFQNFPKNSEKYFLKNH